MSELSISRYSFTPVDNQVWNNSIDEAKNSLFFFKREFMDYHRSKFVDHSLFVNKSGETIAVFPATENGTEIISHGGLTFGSLIFGRKVKSVDVLKIFELLITYYKEKGFEKVIYKCIPYIFCSYTAQEDLYALFRLNAKLVRRDVSSVICLEDAIPFSQSLKNLVNRFDREADHYAFSESQEYGPFWTLLSNVLSKFNTSPVHSLSEILLLKERFNKEIKLFTVYEGEELLAGTVIFDFGSVVHTQYMANSEKGRKKGALTYLIYKLIHQEYQHKKYLSFGISNENNGRYLNEGLIQQKENMGGRAITLDFYEIDI